MHPAGIHTLIYSLTPSSTLLSILHWSIHPSTFHLIHPSIHLPIMHLAIHPSFHPISSFHPIPPWYRSCGRSGPLPGTPLGPPGPSPSAGPPAHWCHRHTGSGSCSSSASPPSWRSPSARRSRLSSKQWGSHGDPGRCPAGSCCLE